jgi:hypothetical protein
MIIPKLMLQAKYHENITLSTGIFLAAIQVMMNYKKKDF